MMSLPWRGRFVRVEQDGSVAWAACVACGRELSDAESVARGLGADCARTRSEDTMAKLREGARAHDRALWRQGSKYSPLRIPPERERLVAVADADAERRWQQLQDALQGRS